MPHIDHSTISSFAQDKVNLSGDKVQKYREQVKALLDRLKSHIVSRVGLK